MVRIIFMNANKLFMYKIIISDDRGYRGPTNFEKTRFSDDQHVARWLS